MGRECTALIRAVTGEEGACGAALAAGPQPSKTLKAGSKTFSPYRQAANAIHFGSDGNSLP